MLILKQLSRDTQKLNDGVVEPEFEPRSLLPDFAFLNKHPPISDKVSYSHVYVYIRTHIFINST